MKTTTTHPDRWLRALALFLALLVSAVSADAQAPVITSELEVVAVLGQPFSYDIQADNQPLGYSVTNPPYWLKREGSKLLGTPVKLGASKMKLTALNADGVSQPVVLIVNVLNEKPVAKPVVVPISEPEIVSKATSEKS